MKFIHVVLYTALFVSLGQAGPRQRNYQAEQIDILKSIESSLQQASIQVEGDQTGDLQQSQIEDVQDEECSILNEMDTLLNLFASQPTGQANDSSSLHHLETVLT